MTVFVVDLGATWLRTALYHPDRRSLSAIVRQPTPDDPAACRAAIENAWRNTGHAARIGLAAAPGLDGNVVRRWSNRPNYIGHALIAPRLAEAASFAVVDDGTAMAISASAEAAAGPGEIVLALAVGTGIGGGAVIGGRPLIGRGAAAMDVGHIKVAPAAGRLCSCGAEGCAQAVGSGRGVAALLAAGLPEALALDLATEAIGALIDILAKTFDPDRIALSGGLGLGALSSRLTAPGFAPLLAPHPHGEAAGLIGAGLHAITD